MSVDDEERRRLATTFNRAAELYDRARPGYPPGLYDRLLAVTRLTSGARLLEVGCGTGKATLPLAQRGFRITALEPGTALATVARRNLAGFDTDVVESTFEDWTTAPASAADQRFAMVCSATAWHWVDPAVRYRRAAAVLEPRGFLAIWSAGHVVPVGGDPFFEQIQEVYDEIGESLPPGTTIPRPDEIADDRDEIEAGGLFEVVDIARFDWEVVYDADGYIALLDTFSGHIAMHDWQRARLYGEVRRRLAARPGGRVRRHWGSVLHIARRRADTSP